MNIQDCLKTICTNSLLMWILITILYILSVKLFVLQMLITVFEIWMIPTGLYEYALSLEISALIKKWILNIGLTLHI